MTKPSVLAIGLDPSFVDFSAFPQYTPEIVRGYIGRSSKVCARSVMRCRAVSPIPVKRLRWW